MPPLTQRRPSALHVHIELSLDNSFECADQQRGGVRHLDAVQRDARTLGFLGGGDVDVVEDLEMVGEELHGDDQDVPVVRRPQAGEQILHVGCQPRLGGVAGALVRELPARRVQTRAVGDGLSGPAELIDVAGVAVDDSARQAVRCEDHRDRVAPAGGQARERAGDQLMQALDPLIGVVPCARDANVNSGVSGARCPDGSFVAAQDDRRVLRRQQHRQNRCGAAVHERLHRAADERGSVQHPDGHAQRVRAVIGVERALQRHGLRCGDVEQRRAADPGVAALELGDQLSGHRTSGAHRGQVRGDLVRRHRGAERDQEDAGHCGGSPGVLM